jgi:DNA-binding response OmpR family regulator
MAYEVLKGLDMVSEFSPDLILVDIELPDTEGFEICSLLKSDNRL